MRSRRSRFRNANNNLATLNTIKLILFILIIIFALIFIYSSIKMKTKLSNKNNIQNNYSKNITIADNTSTNENILDNTTNVVPENPVTTQKNDITINMAFTGDIMCHTSIYKDAYDSETETYDFSHIFENIKYNIQTADIAVR